MTSLMPMQFSKPTKRRASFINVFTSKREISFPALYRQYSNCSAGFPNSAALAPDQGMARPTSSSAKLLQGASANKER